jgi:hypothetical protein
MDWRWWKADFSDDTIESNIAPVLSLWSRARDGMQLVDMPTHISKVYVR